MSTTLASRIRDLIEEQASLERERYALNSWDSDMKLGRPADDSAIKKAEAKLGFRFPPSFRAYLRQHNGWMGFWPDWSLLGVSGTLTEKMLKNARESVKGGVDMIEHDAYLDKEEPEARLAELRESQRTDPDVIYAPDHPLIGTDFNGSVLVFDRFRCDEDGECEVVAVDHLGEVQSRWDSFVALLEDAASETREEVESLRAQKAK